MSTASLPDGFVVRLDRTTRRYDGGRLLVGGSPLTAMRLAPAAAALLRDDRVVVADEASRVLAGRLTTTNLAQPVTEQMAEMASDDVTVVVPVRDRPEQLDRCLAALAPLRVLVVDDASHDPDAVASAARRHGADVVHLPENVGPAGARNAGLAEVRTPLVAFVDSDVEAPASVLLRLARHFADPSVALVGPRVSGHVRRRDPRWFERYDAAASSLSLGARPYSVRPGAGVAWLPSACLVGLTERLGDGFDANLRVGEDVDLVWRLVNAGWRVRYDPDAVVRHDVRPTVQGWLGRKVVYGSGGALLAERHDSYVAPAVLSPAMAVAGAALVVRHRWSPAVAAAALVYSAATVSRALPSDLPFSTRARVAGGLATRGLGWAVRQQSALLVRHWWPATLALSPSPVMRRAAATALVVDSVVAMTEERDAKVDLPTLLVGRRLDDLAYGAGLWWGALRARSLGALRPRRPGGSGGPDGTTGGLSPARRATRSRSRAT